MRLLILGSGGCGRECLQWARDINERENRWDFIGFLDIQKEFPKNVNCSAPIVATEDEYKIQTEDEFVCAIGNSKLREKVMDKMLSRGAEFINLIHPTAVLADSATLGMGVILYPYSIVSDNAVIQDGCIINMHSTVAHDVRMGKYCTISAHCDITGECKVGDYVFMGTSSHMVPTTKVGDNAFICAGSTVMTRVKNDAKVMGNPARKIDF